MTNPISGLFRRQGRYSTALDRAMATTVPGLTTRIRRDATDAGWDQHVASQLQVRKVGKAFAISVPDEVADEAMDLEYGTSEKTPTAVVRHFADHDEWHAQLIAAALREAGL